MACKSHLTQLVHFDQATEERLTIFTLAVIDQLINEALASAATMNKQVFQLFQPREVQPQLRVAPTRELSDVTPAEAIVRAFQRQSLANFGDHLIDKQQQPPGL